MTVSFKDALKFAGITIIACCAVLVCNMFLNYDIDLRAIDGAVDDQMRTLYDALLLNNKVVCGVAGGCLVLTSVVMLVFYIGQYVQSHSERFGILKALGYGDFRVSLGCAVFGICVFVGTVVGTAISWAIMPSFYRAQNDGGMLPEVVMKFHAVLPICLIILPTVIFSALSVGIAWFKLRQPALALIKGIRREKVKKLKQKQSDRPFLREMGLNVLNEKKLLAFFIAFGSFCFSAMTQMGLSMRNYASDMMGYMILVIGLVLAATSLWLAFTTVVNGNAKKIAMLKVCGYDLKESGVAVLGLYHIPACIGFMVGVVYQYGLLNIMINIVFSSFDDVPHYSFDWAVFGICLAIFVVAYEALNLIYTLLIAKTPVKSIMSE
ncbi:MAG: ABC transporter permease [Clostridia bacterium]|nr:ABC transporter permease [Clostridia bacterium]